MSDSGFTQFPPGGSNGGPRDITQIPGRGERGDGENVRLIGVPNELREVHEPIRLRAEIIRDNGDGSVRVRTQRGEFDIRPERGQAERPETGQRVEIEIRPGSPPQQAVVRDAPPETQTTPVEVRHAPRPEQAPQSQEAREARPAQTPVNVEVRPPEARRQDGPPLEPQRIVRLLPLAPTRVAEITQPILEVIQSNLVQRTEIAVQIIVTEGQAQELTNLLQVAPQAPVLDQKIPILALAQAKPVLQTVQTTTEILPPILTQTFQAPIIPTVQFVTQQENTILQTLPQPTILSVPITEATAQPILATPAQTTALQPQPIEFQPFEARITAVQQPEVQILPPTIQGADNVQQTTKPLILQSTPTTSTAQVVGFVQDNNLPVVSFALPNAALGVPLFVLQTPNAPLVVGSQIQLTPQAGTITTAAGQILPPLISPSTPIPAILLAPEPWPVLEQIHQALLQAAPQVAQAMSNVTPSASNPAQLGPAAMFFLAAIRSGDIASWLGDKASDILRREGKGNLLSRLTQEGSILSRLSAEPINQEWRGMAIPHFWQGDIYKMALYYKQDGGSGDEGQDKGKQTRFIFDLNLTQMGKVQLDGLYRGTDLDLVIRTKTQFSQTMQMDMRKTYTNALRQTELSGELTFQNRPEQWVHVNPQDEVFGAEV